MLDKWFVNSILLAALLTPVVAGLPNPAAAGVNFSIESSLQSPILLVPVKAKKCVYLEKRMTSETLVNKCRTCQIVNLRRKRSGNLAPTQRTYTVPGKSRIELSFRGPGHTRILSNIDCNKSTPEVLEGRKCVRFHRFSDGSPALFNECPACRTVVIEREDDEGDRKRSTYTLNNRAYLPLQTYGAKIARIVSDKACR